jgi:hypothetical protein
MPSKRTPLRREIKRRITAEAVEAYAARDYSRLHRALGLRPWHISPLRCDPEQPPTHNLPWNDSWQQAAELRVLLEEAIARRAE